MSVSKVEKSPNPTKTPDQWKSYAHQVIANTRYYPLTPQEDANGWIEEGISAKVNTFGEVVRDNIDPCSQIELDIPLDIIRVSLDPEKLEKSLERMHRDYFFQRVSRDRRPTYVPPPLKDTIKEYQHSSQVRNIREIIAHKKLTKIERLAFYHHVISKVIEQALLLDIDPKYALKNHWKIPEINKCYREAKPAFEYWLYLWRSQKQREHFKKISQ
ncbi:MAG: hypothetical protein V1858_00680 [Candidatus Gottesmanbacteria bacterium]